VIALIDSSALSAASGAITDVIAKAEPTRCLIKFELTVFKLTPFN
jgi:hypothetical protein